MAQEYQYFYEDEVYRFNKKGNLELGMVLENAEFVSSDEESDGDEEDKVTKGSIRVAWYPKGEEQVLPERKVRPCYYLFTCRTPVINSERGELPWQDSLHKPPLPSTEAMHG